MLCMAGLWSVIAAQWSTASTAPLSFVAQLDASSDTRVVDVRAQDMCEKGSLAGARCLPATDLFDANGRPPTFHALRWLFGTIGLTGHEKVAVVADKADDAAAVGALLFLAGARDVAILNRPLVVSTDAAAGHPRSLAREAVFTARMRDEWLIARPDETDGSAIASGILFDRLRTFAHHYTDGSPPARLRLIP